MVFRFFSWSLIVHHHHYRCNATFSFISPPGRGGCRDGRLLRQGSGRERTRQGGKRLLTGDQHRSHDERDHRTRDERPETLQGGSRNTSSEASDTDRPEEEACSPNKEENGRNLQAGTTSSFQDTPRPEHIWPTECTRSHRTPIGDVGAKRGSPGTAFLPSGGPGVRRSGGCREMWGRPASGNTPGLPCFFSGGGGDTGSALIPMGDPSGTLRHDSDSRGGERSRVPSGG